ncbi:hypothetical protein [Streptomyces sp. NPDC002845]
MDGDTGAPRRDHLIDWLEQSPDLPHLIARISELVHRYGYDPEDLVVLPRGELDRRELAAYSAGWADVVSEHLPAIRRAYEERITAAYRQGQEEARVERRARRPEGGSGGGGEVVALPYVRLLGPPSVMTRVEERGERERSLAEGVPVPLPTPEPEPEARGGAEEQPPPRPEADILLSAREVREKRAATPERRRVVRRKGRASVPPLTRPSDVDHADRSRGSAEEGKGKALADELGGRAAVRQRGEPGSGTGSGSGTGARGSG